MATYATQRPQWGPRSPRHQFFGLSDEANDSADKLDSPSLATGYFSQAVSRNSSFTNLTAPFRTFSYDSMATAKSRPKSQHDRPKLSTHGPATSYGFPNVDEASLELDSDSLVYEILTAILLPLPFLLSSLNNPLDTFSFHPAHLSTTEIAEEVLEDAASMAIPFPSSLLSMIEACALTSGTLLIVGLFAQLRQDPTRDSSRKSVPKKITKWLSFQNLRRIFLRMVCVGLPYLATVEIGGARTAIVLLSAVTAGLITPQAKHGESKSLSTWKRAISTRRWTLSVLVACLVYDLFYCPPGVEVISMVRGYLALVKSIFVIQPPLPTPTLGFTRLNEVLSPSATLSNSTAWEAPSSSPTSGSKSAVSALVKTSEDAKLTFVSGVVLALITFALTTVLTPRPPLQPSTVFLFAISVIAAASLYLFAHAPSLRSSSNRYGLLTGITFSGLFGIYYDTNSWSMGLSFLGLCIYAYFAVVKDVGSKALRKKTAVHTHVKATQNTGDTPSTVTRMLLHWTEDMPLLHGILKDKESRRITYFMFVNFAFMFVQTFYALLAGSLGLLSDSIHMFFDCVGLLAGLVAAVMSKWPPNSKFPYGYGKVETLSGLGNGIFLMLISVEIIWESFERFMEGSELRHLNELLLVSVGGLAVNLIGLVFIGHAHHGHGHDHHHHHGDENENMAGIYLHILADTMGSVAVIVSTILTYYTGWSGWDPIASCIIAVLIILASYPLVTSSAKRLLLTLPADAEYNLRTALSGLSNLRGIVGYAVPRFWVDDSEPQEEGHHHHHHHHHDGQDHSHEHVNQHTHSHTHSHSSSHSSSVAHSRNHSTDHIHSHNHEDHGHDHSHHDHSHDHENDHHHHQHNHSQHEHSRPSRLHGVVHIIAARNADLNDVRTRAYDFLKEHGLEVLIQMEREGDRRCWCGGMGGAHGRGLSTVMI